MKATVQQAKTNARKNVAGNIDSVIGSQHEGKHKGRCDGGMRGVKVIEHAIGIIKGTMKKLAMVESMVQSF